MFCHKKAEAVECLLKTRAFVVKRTSGQPETRKGQVTWSKYASPCLAWREAKHRSGFWRGATQQSVRGKACLLTGITSLCRGCQTTHFLDLRWWCLSLDDLIHTMFRRSLQSAWQKTQEGKKDMRECRNINCVSYSFPTSWGFQHHPDK